MCYYLDGITKFEDFDFDNILINEKLHKNSFFYNNLYKTLIREKPLLIRFHKVNRFVRVYDVIKYLILFSFKKLPVAIELDIL